MIESIELIKDIGAARIIGMGNYRETIDSDVPDLKPLLKATLGASVRRIDRFIQLALIGAARCIHSARHIDAEQSIQPPSDTAIYIASGRGDMEITVEVQRDLFVNGHEPKPLNFINTVSNAASFYIAQSFGLCGRNQFIANRHWAFEVALQSALLDLQLGNIDSALVGVVDVVVPPIAEHRQRLKLSETTTLAEGSHWLWLDNDTLPATTLGSIEGVYPFIDRQELADWIKSPSLAPENQFCSRGQFMTPEDFAAVRQHGELQQEFIYRDDTMGYYDSQSGSAIAAFIESSQRDARFLHINSDPLQRYIAMVARKS
ncbi:MAG: beta-ketoacyl synthase N-terminal-like domain-containing protein [Spongiibacteraceae bacterium]